MNDTIYSISLLNLLLIFVPVVVVIIIYVRWSLSYATVMYATLRMVLQLILVGYALNFIFFQNNVLITSLILAIMLIISAWIALRPIKQKRRTYYAKALLALVIGGVPTLILVISGVIQLIPWHLPQYLIPIAGMIFANSMNSVSLCAERFSAERERGTQFIQARNLAYQTALLPLINSFFAVGLVSFPGMMTGQILAGISPLIAVRYQIMVMCMVFSAAGISSAVYLHLLKSGRKQREGQETIQI